LQQQINAISEKALKNFTFLAQQLQNRHEDSDSESHNEELKALYRGFAELKKFVHQTLYAEQLRLQSELESSQAAFEENKDNIQNLISQVFQQKFEQSLDSFQKENLKSQKMSESELNSKYKFVYLPC